MAESYPLFASRTLPAPRVFSVSELSLLIKGTLNSAFPSLWVNGEVSEVSKPRSGHVYFTLRDESAVLNAVIWQSTAKRLRFQLEEGQQVVCLGDIDVYPPHGNYKLVVRQVEPTGLGALQLAFKQLQARLAAEGLFDAERKRPLPLFPRRVGFVTSPSGAAIRDFLQVAARRFHGVEILVIPARVQGDGAAAEIARGIELANHVRPALGVLVVGRGGGSLEDLWPFNEEIVVRAIFASEVPVVSAVGHEIDVTLADLVADVRALTPSEAAELVIPSAQELSKRLAGFHRRIVAMLRSQAAATRRHLDQLARCRVLRNPRSLIDDRAHRLGELDLRLSRAMNGRVKSARERLVGLARRAESLSPLSVLARGYSVTSRAADGRIVRDSSDLTVGDELVTRLSRGQFHSTVTEIVK